MSSLNEATILGNVGKDPEIKSMQNGGKVANFSIATSERWKDKQSGEQKERTEWHRIAVFNEHIVSVVERFVKKGSKVLVKGQLQTRKWTDQSGAEKYTTEIVLKGFDAKLVLVGDRSDSAGSSAPAQQQSYSKPAASTSQSMSDFDDDIPF